MKRFLLIALVSLTFCEAFAQVAITDQAGNPVPDNSAILDLQSTDRGFLPPRMSTVDRDSISTPPPGLMIYNTTTSCIQVFHSIQGWTDFSCDCNNPPSAAFTSPVGITQFAAANFSANSPGLTYSWSFQNGIPSSSTAQNPSVTWNSPGSYLVSLIVTDGSGCTDSAGMMITVNSCTPPSSAFTNPGTGAVNVAANFSANTAGQNYAWTFASGTPATSTSQSPSVTWSAAGTYNVQLIVSDANGCADTSIGTITIQTCVTGGSQTFSYTGSAVDFIVPNACGAITIEAWGAQGGSATQNNDPGGLGARMRGDFTTLVPGETLRVMVGQVGNSSQNTAGGGGGSGVVRTNGSPLVIAGGGGGVDFQQPSYSGRHAVTSSNGVDGQGNVGSGGTGGADGIGHNFTSNDRAYGGRGFNSGNFGSTGQNGVSTSALTTNGSWGLGGGGGSVGNGRCNCGGGGGGYSGGGSGTPNQSGGGGGSINNGTNQSNTGATRSGNGQVIISW